MGDRFAVDIRQLRYFLTVAEEGQITRAAAKLNMAQPPLSQQIRLLETELNTILFTRKGRSIELTQAGRVLYQKGKNLLESLEDIQHEVKEVEAGMRGVLSIGTVISCLSVLSPKIVEFRSKHPLISFRIMEGDTYSLSNQLYQREVEAAIIRLPIDTKDFSIQYLPREPYILLTPSMWNITEETIKMQELKSIPLLLLHRRSGTGVYEIIVDECKKLGIPLNIVCESADPTVLMSLVAQGLGAALLPKSTALLFQLKETKIIYLEDCQIQSEAAIIWLKDRYLSKAATAFIESYGDGKS